MLSLFSKATPQRQPVEQLRLSGAGLDLIARWEGVRLRVYNDAAGLATIGYGHLITDDEHHSGLLRIGDEWVPWRDGLSDDQALELLSQDAHTAERAIQRNVTVPLTQSEYDALVSWAFNVGGGNVATSTLIRRLNSGHYRRVPGELRRWVYAGGKKRRGLANRRQAEIKHWQSAA